MNSIYLEKNNSKEYRDFFSRNDLVVSWNFSFPWAPWWYWNRSNFAFIVQKINLKCYVWFNKTKEKSIKFGNINYYDISQEKFIKQEFINISEENDKLWELVKKLFNIKDFWVEIEILSETTRWHSFWFFGTFSSIFATGLSILSNSLTTEELDNYSEFVEFWKKDKVFEKALQFEYLSRYWNTIGQTWLSVLNNSIWPFYLISNKIENKDFKLSDLNQKAVYFSENYAWPIVTQELPFDYCMVFTWLQTNTKNIESYKHSWVNNLYELADFIKTDIIWENNNLFSNFTDKKEVKKNHISNITLSSAKMIRSLSKLYSYWYDQNLVDDFIHSANEYRYSTSLIEKQSNFAEDFIYYFRKNTNNIWQKIGVAPVCSWKIGGGYLIVTPLWSSREAIKKSILDLKWSFPNIELEYSSFDDWVSSDWVKVDQFITKEIYSKYIDNTKYKYKDNKWKTYIWDYNDIIEAEKEWLLFDMISNKIYLDWKKLTSKDIHSQTTTIEILIKLLESSSKEILNKDLSISSYSKNKNEMVWKIILPFIKFIDSKTGYKLNISCTWSITDFKIVMSDVKLKIAILDRF